METESIPVGSYYVNGLDYSLEPASEDMPFPRTIYYETSGRAEVDTGMKQSEQEAPSKPDAPMHSSVDESDFSGVVDGPTKNVKEIRAMFKAHDHANYAKPKQVLKRTSPPTTLPKPKLRPEKSPGGSKRNSAEVAQQVMGLFKGAMELEQDTQIQRETVTSETSRVVTEESGATLKEKIASFDEVISTYQENITKDVSIPKQKRESLTDKKDAPYVEIIKNPSPVAVANGHERKSSVKQEKVLADTYDESLDQFYDVFDQLTAS